MKLPKLSKPEKYTGLYVIDFDDQASTGFTAEEVAEILESEKFKDCKVYKIHRASPDGTLELKGVRPETFQLEAGMIFYADDLETAESNFRNLVDLAVRSAPPCRAKVQLAEYNDKFVTALIYPAEYDDEISSWLLAGNYNTAGAAQGGTNAVQSYYDSAPQVLQRHQLFPKPFFESRTGQDLLANLKVAVQR